jgi:hypothetical protein
VGDIRSRKFARYAVPRPDIRDRHDFLLKTDTENIGVLPGKQYHDKNNYLKIKETPIEKSHTY